MFWNCKCVRCRECLLKHALKEKMRANDETPFCLTRYISSLQRTGICNTTLGHVRNPEEGDALSDEEDANHACDVTCHNYMWFLGWNPDEYAIPIEYM